MTSNTPSKELTTLKEQEQKMLIATEGLTITNQDDYDQAVTVGKKVSAYIKSIDTKEKAITKPINDSLKEIRALFKPFKETAEAQKSYIKSVMAEYLQAEAKKVAEAEAKIEARLERGTMREDTAVNKLATLEENKTATTGTTTNVLKVEVLNIKDIPAEFLTVNESAIKEAYRAGQEVAGVRCYYEQAIRL